MNRPARLALPLFALLALTTGRAEAEPGAEALQPYQMVRSLQLVQDRIAGGDHAALPMQRKLLEMIDTRLRDASGSDFADRRNARALMIYAMSGGNPMTVAANLVHLDMDEGDRMAASGILGYLTGDMEKARNALSGVEPESHPHEVSAFLSLVKGSVLAGDDAATGLAMLDKARLLSPGTLVEEAALRRTVSLAVSTRDGATFMSASEQYARRFLRSPYASQFAETFVSGIIELRDAVDLARIEQAIAWMTAEQAGTIYLRLARRAAIDVDEDLLAFASRKASEYVENGAAENTTRSELYSSISSVTSDTVDDVLSTLEQLDPTGLSARDRALLDAAKSVASEVVAPVRAPPSSAYARPLAASGDAEASERVLSIRARLEAVDKLLEEAEQ